VLAIHGYPHPSGKDLPNLVNAGLYILEKRALAALEATDALPEKPDFGKHVFARMLDQGMRLFGYRSPEYIKDAGTPERLEKTGKDLRSGRVAALSLRTPSPAVFLDRDGVINEERSYISDPDQVVLIEGAAEALRLLNRSHFRTVIITNQPVVARGEATEAQLQQIHNRLDTLLGAQGAYVDALYFCPHHPDKGFAGERAELKMVCDCRKPARGMIDRAAADLNIDIAASWYIGDMTTDIELARRCGMRSVLVETGFGGKDGKYAAQPTHVSPSIHEAVAFILDRVAQT
jgi:histidinol-phosphate phosphatase family protein